MVWYNKALAAGGRYRACFLESSGWVAFAFIVFAVQYFLCLQTGRAVVSVEIESSLQGTFKVYWRHLAGTYQESDSVDVLLTPDKHHYTLVIPSLFTLSELRIDPLAGPGKIALRRMSIRQPLCQQVLLNFQDFSEKYPIMQGLAVFNPDHGSGVELTSVSEDSWFIVETECLINPRILALWVVAAVLAGLVLNFLLHSNVLRGGRYSGVLQVEFPEGQSSCSDKWFEDLTTTLPDLHLIRTTEQANLRIYQFAFIRAASTDFEAMIDRVQRHHPSLRLHLQMSRSGEVN